MPKYDFNSFDEESKKLEASPSKPKYDFGSFEKGNKTEAPQDVSYLESLLRGGAQGATMGSADEISGGAQALYHKAMDPGDAKLMDLYRKYRDASRGEFKAAEDANPKTFMAGNIAGGVATTPFLPEVAGIKGAMAVGAGLGAAQGLGSSNADITQGDVGGALKDTAIGAGVGGVAGLAGGALSKALTPEALEAAGAARAGKVGGSSAGERKNLLRMPGSTETAETRLAEHNKLLNSRNPYLDNKYWVEAGDTASDVLNKAKTILPKAGKDIGDVLNTVDAAARQNPEIAELLPKGKTFGDKIRELQAEFTPQHFDKSLPSDVALNSGQDAFNKLGGVIADIETISKNGPMNFNTAQKLKELIQRKAYGNSEGKDPIMQEVYSIINEQIEKSADAATQAMNNPSLYNKYIDAKNYYRAAKDQLKMSGGQEAREMGHRDFGLTDFILGAGALAHGNLGAMVLVGTKKLADKYGNSMAAAGTRKTADIMQGINSAFTKAPEALEAVGNSMISSGDPLKSKLGSMLVEASKKDDVGRNAVIFSLMQLPKYRSLMKDVVTPSGSSEGTSKSEDNK